MEAGEVAHNPPAHGGVHSLSVGALPNNRFAQQFYDLPDNSNPPA
jgi:hypothetical protein